MKGMLVLATCVMGCDVAAFDAFSERKETVSRGEGVDLGGGVDGDLVVDGGTSTASDSFVADMTPVADMVPLVDLLPDCSITRLSCKAHLDAGCMNDGVYSIQPRGLGVMQVYCDQHADGGGWVLAYSNSNNWADVNAADITSEMVNGNVVYKWFDSKWRLERALHKDWLGQVWDEKGALTPDVVGGVNVKALYDAGMVVVRFEFVRGMDGATETGWCDTTGQGWDWGVENTKTYKCKAGGNGGSGTMVCLAGMTTCDSFRDGWNSGWENNVSLGAIKWDYAFQAAPNHLAPELDHNGSSTNMMIIGWEQLDHANNAIGKNYQMRIWIR